jgi:enediyne biosynthesis protein E4
VATDGPAAPPGPDPREASRGPSPGPRASRGRRNLLVGAALVALAIGVGAALTTLGIGPLSTGGALGAPRFVEETAGSGLAHTYGGDDTFDVGGGVAVFDCDDDGRPDVYLAGGGEPASLFRNESPTGGALRFTRLASPVTDLTSVTGAYPLDVDGDGIVDLAVLRIGGSQLLRGIGDCRFEAANDPWGVSPTPAPTMAFSATWEGSATWPTLAFGNYVEPKADGSYFCPDNEAFRPDGTDGRYGRPIPLSPGYCPLSMLFSDWDGSGRRDLRVSNDRQYYDDDVGGEQLWRFEPGKLPRAYAPADGWKLLRLWGMGIASYDVTGDGYPEVYLTSQGANTLQTLVAGPSEPTYHDMALKRGIVATRPAVGGDPLPSTAWHPEFQDVNNDGFMDLFVSKGNVNQIPDYAIKDPNNLFLGRADGMFTESAEAAGIVSFDRGRGAALADFNDDGLLDLLVANLGAPARLWRNVGAGSAGAPAPMGDWLAVRVSQPGGNRDAIGAVVETRTPDASSRREIVVGGGHGGGQLGWTHFGLGKAGQAEVRVTWPDGEVGPWLTAAANGFVEIERGASAVLPWQPPGP